MEFLSVSAVLILLIVVKYLTKTTGDLALRSEVMSGSPFLVLIKKVVISIKGITGRRGAAR